MSKAVKIVVQESLETRVEQRLAESTPEERVAFLRLWFAPYCPNCGFMGTKAPICDNCTKIENERWKKRFEENPKIDSTTSVCAPI